MNRLTNGNILCPMCSSKNIFFEERISITKIKEIWITYYNYDPFYTNTETEINLIQCKNCKLKFYHPLIVGDLNLYKRLQKENWYYQDDKSEYSYAIKFINSNDNLLEIGCGKGVFSKKINAASYIGLEPGKIDNIKEDETNICILNETIEKHAERKRDKYDVVCSFQVLEHIADIASFIKHSLFCLKKNGYLIISVPNDDSYIRFLQNSILNMPPHHLSHWSPETLKNVAEIFSLEIVEINCDKLDEIHKEIYARVIAKQALNRVLGLNQSRVDISISNKFLISLSKIIGKFINIGLCDERLLPIGHSVTAVYKK